MDDNTAKVLLAVLPATVTGLLTWHLTSRSQKLFYPQKWWERQAQAYDNIMGALGDLDLVLGEWEQYFTHQILLSEEYRADLFKKRVDAVLTIKKLSASGDFLITSIAADALRKAASSLDVDLGVGDPMADIQKDIKAVD